MPGPRGRPGRPSHPLDGAVKDRHRLPPGNPSPVHCPHVWKARGDPARAAPLQHPGARPPRGARCSPGEVARCPLGARGEQRSRSRDPEQSSPRIPRPRRTPQCGARRPCRAHPLTLPGAPGAAPRDQHQPKEERAAKHGRERTRRPSRAGWRKPPEGGAGGAGCVWGALGNRRAGECEGLGADRGRGLRVTCPGRAWAGRGHRGALGVRSGRHSVSGLAVGRRTLSTLLAQALALATFRSKEGLLRDARVRTNLGCCFRVSGAGPRASVAGPLA